MKHWLIPETGHFYKANLHPDQEEAYQGCPRRDGNNHRQGRRSHEPDR